MPVKFSEFPIGAINADLEIVGFNSATPANVQVSYPDIKNDILASAIKGTVAIGQVPFGSAANTVSGSNNLFWDNVNARLGIGTNTPANNLTVKGLPGANGTFALNTFERPNGLVFNWFNAGNVGEIHYYAETRFRRNAAELNLVLSGTGNIILGTNIDSGQRLQVNGTSIFTDILNITGTDNLNTLNFISRSLSGITQFQISNNGDAFSRNSLTTPVLNSNILRAQQNQNILLEANWATSNVINLQTYFNATNVLLANHSANVVRTSGGNVVIQGTETFAPTGGNATTILALLNPTINQIGGANGITRGLYVAPTLTAAADWRSIEWSNNTGWGLYGAGTADNYLAGKLLIGTTVVGTQALQVNGDVFIKGSGTTSATNALVVQNSSGLNQYVIANNGEHFFYSNNNPRLTIANSICTFGSSLLISSTNSLSLGQENRFDINYDSVNTIGRIRVNNGGMTNALTVTTLGTVRIGIGQGIVQANLSSVLELSSTTLGFLPPRMTTTQINEISTPAEGLQVYNTTINHMCVYQAGAWVKLSHSPM